MIFCGVKLMTKLDYLSSLERYLKRQIPEEEIYEIMRDYAEYFEDGKNQGKTEDEISASLGSPYDIARQIVTEEKGEQQIPKQQRPKIDYKKVSRKVKDLNIGGFFLLLVLVFLMILIVPPLIFLLASATVMFAFLALAGIIGLIVAVSSFVFGTFWIGLCSLFASIFCIALGVGGAIFCGWLVRKCYRYLVERFHRYTRPVRKQQKNAEEEGEEQNV